MSALFAAIGRAFAALLKWLIAAVFLGAMVHGALVWFALQIIMGFVLSGVAERAGGTNRMLHAEPVTAAAREVVMPSPDLLYSLCSVELLRGPVRVTAPRPAGALYWSVALYSETTDNVFVTNDRTAPTGADFVIVGPGQASLAPDGVQVVESPSFDALILIRTLVDRPDALDGLDRERRQAVCAPAG